MYRLFALALSLSFLAFMVMPVSASNFFFSTGTPDGSMATASRPSSASGIQIETADDFVLTNPTLITNATFTGLLPTGASLSSVKQVEVEIYHVFPVDSTNPPSGNVTTRVNSPADVEITSATRDSNKPGDLTFTPGIVNPVFTANNSVLNGINKSPNQRTGGEGSVTGQEVTFNVIFTIPISLSADHYFFRPEVLLDSGNFYWLSAPQPIVPPGTPFPAGFTDLQSWTRNDNLAPDWSRIGTDIVGGTTPPKFNASFSLSGEVAPVPSTLLLLGSGILGLASWGRFKKI